MKRASKASFTAEAAVVVSLIWILTALLLQLSLYVHDAGVLKGAAYEAAQKGAARKDSTDKAVEQYAKTEAAKLLENRRMACRITGIRVRSTSRRVEVHIEAETGFLGGRTLQVKGEAAKCNPVNTLRIEQRLSGLNGKRGGNGQ